MKRLTAHESLAYIGHLQNVLEQAGVGCIIKNAQLSGGLGEIPFLECMPELWVLSDSDLELARKLLRDLESPAEDAPHWSCKSCNELIEGQFVVCWNCGTTAENI